jgi:hypothetical protein
MQVELAEANRRLAEENQELAMKEDEARLGNSLLLSR